MIDRYLCGVLLLGLHISLTSASLMTCLLW